MGLNDTLAFLKEKHSSKPEEKESKIFQLEEKYWSIILHALHMYARERNDTYMLMRAKGKTRNQLRRLIEDMDNINILLKYLRGTTDENKNKIIYR